MYRRQLGDEKTRRNLQRLDKRLLGVASQLQRIQTEQKWGTIGQLIITIVPGPRQIDGNQQVLAKWA